MYRSVWKRFFDFLGALIGLVILSPIFILVMLLLFISYKGNPFFLQKRPGKNEKIFKIIKFKSMNDKKDNKGKLLPDKERVTKLGVFIRKTSLDEIPQLINVLKGDMSFIGPRPLLVRYLPFYTNTESLRHSVRPGITGLAQVNGRNTIGWDKKLKFDVEYVEKYNFLFDLKIFLNTINKVVKRKDISVIPSNKGKLLDVERSFNCLVLRSLCIDDLELRVDWLNDSRINKTMNLNFPINIETTKKWFAQNSGNLNRLDLVLCYNGEVEAMTGFSKLDSKKAESYTFVNPEKKGEGYGSIALFLKLVYIFNIRKIDEVFSVIDIDNIASRKMVEKLGFLLDKIVDKDLEKNGVKIDRCYYSCKKDNFKSNFLPYKIYKNVITYEIVG